MEGGMLQIKSSKSYLSMYRGGEVTAHIIGDGGNPGI